MPSTLQIQKKRFAKFFRVKERVRTFFQEMVRTTDAVFVIIEFETRSSPFCAAASYITKRLPK
jgi:hypothetical protein